MNSSFIVKIDNQEVTERLLELARRGENLRPLMKNIAGIFAYSTEENFKEQGRPEKWVDLAESTKKQRMKKRKWPGQILQVEGKLAASVNTQYDDNSAVIGSNLDYARIHQLGGAAGKGKKVNIPARPYLKLTDNDAEETGSVIEIAADGATITFSGNQAGKDGGAIYNNGDIGYGIKGELNIIADSDNIIFSNNTATRNGGSIAN